MNNSNCRWVWMLALVAVGCDQTAKSPEPNGKTSSIKLGSQPQASPIDEKPSASQPIASPAHEIPLFDHAGSYAAITPDGQWLVASGRDEPGDSPQQLVRVINLQTEKITKEFKTKHNTPVAITSDGKLVAFRNEISEGGISICGADSGESIATVGMLQSGQKQIEFSSDGASLWAHERDAIVQWDATNGKETQSSTVEKDESIECFAIAADQSFAIVGFRRGGVSIVELATETVRVLEENHENGSPWPTTMTLYGNNVVVSRNDGKTEVWQVDEGKKLVEWDHGRRRIEAFAVLGVNRLLSQGDWLTPEGNRDRKRGRSMPIQFHNLESGDFVGYLNVKGASFTDRVLSIGTNSESQKIYVVESRGVIEVFEIAEWIKE